MKKYFVLNDSKDEAQIEELVQRLLYTKLFDGMEIFYFKHLNEDKFLRYENKIAKLREEKPFDLILHFPYDERFNFADPKLHPSIESVLNDIYRFSEKLKISKITFHLGQNEARGLFEMIQFFRGVLNKFRPLNVQFNIENTYQEKDLLRNCEDFLYYKKFFPEVGFCLDIGHLNLISRNLSSDVLKALPHIGHLHLSNNYGSTDEHLSLMNGTIDYCGIRKLLRESGYEKSYTLEIFYQNAQVLMDNLTYFEEII